MSRVSDETRTDLTRLAIRYFEGLRELDLHDHPMVFEILDEVARARGHMICAEQRGVFGTKLHFQHETNVE